MAASASARNDAHTHTRTGTHTQGRANTRGDRLPVGQLTVLIIVSFNEALQGNIVWPLLAYAVQRWGVSEQETGTYVGFLASAFFLAQFLFVTAWGKASDRFGRRPTLLVGLLGTAVSMCVFGIATSYTMAFIARFLTGALNGNVAITKTYMGEITTCETQARGFAWLSFTWGFGSIVAPAIGGWLSEPAENYPETFGDVEMFTRYPYILPSLLSAAFSLVAFVLGYFALPETEVFLAGEHLSHKRGNATKAGASKWNSRKREQVSPAKQRDAHGARAEHVDESDASGLELVALAAASSPDTAQSERVHRRASVSGRHARADSPHSGDAEAAFRAVEKIGDMHDDMAAAPSTRAGSRAADKPRLALTTLPSDNCLPGTPSKSKGSARSARADDAQHAARSSNCDAAAADTSRLTTAANAAATHVTDARQVAPVVPGQPDDAAPVPTNFMDVFKLSAVLRAISLYGMLCLAQILFDELLPVLCEASPENGGFGFSSSQVGTVQVVAGATQIVFQLFIIPHLVPRFGPLACFRHAMWPLGVLAFFPLVARLGSRPEWLWPVLSATIAAKTAFMTVGFTTSMLLINNSSRGRGLGLINGFAQGTASLVRTLGPTVGGAIFSASMTWTALGQWRLHVIYVVQGAVLVGAALATTMLPRWVDKAPSFSAQTNTKATTDGPSIESTAETNDDEQDDLAESESLIVHDA